MKLVIDRSKWRTGGTVDGSVCTPESGSGKGETQLLNVEGYMCCLGFLGLACGYTPHELLHSGEPPDVVNLAHPTKDPNNKWPSWLLTTKDVEWYDEEGVVFEREIDRENSYIFVTTNDDADLTHEEREEAIAKLFGERDVEVEFVGEYSR